MARRRRGHRGYGKRACAGGSASVFLVPTLRVGTHVQPLRGSAGARREQKARPPKDGAETKSVRTCVPTRSVGTRMQHSASGGACPRRECTAGTSPAARQPNAQGFSEKLLASHIP